MDYHMFHELAEFSHDSVYVTRNLIDLDDQLMSVREEKLTNQISRGIQLGI